MFDVLNDMLSTSPHTPGFQPRLQENPALFFPPPAGLHPSPNPLHLLQNHPNHLVPHTCGLREPRREIPLRGLEAGAVGGEVAERDGFGPAL